MDDGTRNDLEIERTGYRAEAFGDPDDPQAIRADIQRTRERMSRTVEELGDRLNPDRLKGQRKQNLHDATIGKAENMARMAVDRVDDTRHNMMDSIRDNPVPAAMVGIGLGWLFLNSRRDNESTRYAPDYRSYRDYDIGYSGTTLNRGMQPNRYDSGATAGYSAAGRDMDRDSGIAQAAMEKGDELRHRTEEITHQAQDRVTEVAHEARDQARELADRAHDAFESGRGRAREMAHEMADRTRGRAHRVEDRFDETLRESPLAIGAAAVALGMAVGLSAPGTRRESELMGARRDQLMDRARETVGDAAERAREVADRVVTSATETVRDEVDRGGMS